jgi:exodeoxyribonuclease VII large subunit
VAEAEKFQGRFMKNEQKEKHVYSVTELTKYIRVIMEDSFPGVWVEGEISNFILHSSGHMYFSIRDAGASLKCAMFRRSNEKLKFRPKDGMKVICFGSISVYEARGDYQLIVEEIGPRRITAPISTAQRDPGERGAFRRSP